jgi:hypothetical protein
MQPTLTASRRDDFLAVLSLVDPFDLPDVGFDPGVLQLVDGLNHQGWAKLYLPPLRSEA